MNLLAPVYRLAPLLIVLFGLLAYNFMSAQSSWSGPTATAPDSNTPAPINIGGIYQAKLGDLGAIRMRAGSYCNADGTVCTNADLIGGGGGTMANFYTYSTNQNPQAYPNRTACTCKPGELLTGCSGFQRSDNDTEQLPGGVNGCYSDGSTVAKCHCMGSGSRTTTTTYSWNTGAWGLCPARSYPNCTNGAQTQTRTVSCMRSDGVVVADTFCTGAKPTTSQSCSGQLGGSCR